MPFRLPLSLAASLPDDLVRRQREPRHLLLIAERPDLRITAQVPDEDHVIHHDLFLRPARAFPKGSPATTRIHLGSHCDRRPAAADPLPRAQPEQPQRTFLAGPLDRKSTRLNSSHLGISYAVFCLKKKKKNEMHILIQKKKKNIT